MSQSQSHEATPSALFPSELPGDVGGCVNRVAFSAITATVANGLAAAALAVRMEYRPV